MHKTFGISKIQNIQYKLSKIIHSLQIRAQILKTVLKNCQNQVEIVLKGKHTHYYQLRGIQIV